ncbi:Hypothetical predicted protein [Mytilus galloprovincialis]|uniref:Uncharacterized protein n=1 Tax=Mytilus galloprovincialis TaxID=29158 RepID=A0A8B6GL21_MYTGA|nr:Hypothetical predicted protein [Mytilus galloprovincialis]
MKNVRIHCMNHVQCSRWMETIFTPPERTYQEKDQKVRKKLSFEPEERFGRENSARQSEIHAKRTFDGTTQDVWSDFLRYYENIATLNGWSDERKRMKMELRFGHSNMKESYLVEAKLRKRKSGETFRDLGQSIEDLYRRAYPASPDTVQENSIKTFLDACGESEEFRLSVRRSLDPKLYNCCDECHGGRIYQAK